MCRKIISCRKFWHSAKILAQKLDTEKMQKVPCQNSEPEFSNCDKTFDTKFWLEIFWHGILDKSARISSQKFRLEMLFWLEMLFRHADPLISSQWPYSEILRTPLFQNLKYNKNGYDRQIIKRGANWHILSRKYVLRNLNYDIREI